MLNVCIRVNNAQRFSNETGSGFDKKGIESKKERKMENENENENENEQEKPVGQA